MYGRYGLLNRVDPVVLGRWMLPRYDLAFKLVDSFESGVRFLLVKDGVEKLLLIFIDGLCGAWEGVAGVFTLQSGDIPDLVFDESLESGLYVLLGVDKEKNLWNEDRSSSFSFQSRPMLLG